MYKSLIAASLTAIVAYLFASNYLLDNNLLNFTIDSIKSKRAYSSMATSSVSRTVTKKVYAVEQSEVIILYVRD